MVIRRLRSALLASSGLVLLASAPALAQEQECTQRLDQIEQQLAQAQLEAQRQEDIQQVIEGARTLADTGDQEGCMRVVAELENLTLILEEQGTGQAGEQQPAQPAEQAQQDQQQPAQPAEQAQQDQQELEQQEQQVEQQPAQQEEV